MRIWLVPVHELDNDRLIAQHTDLHLVARMIRLGRAFQGWEAKEYYNAFLYLHERTVAEVFTRALPFTESSTIGYGLPQAPPSHIPQRAYPITPEALARDRWHLWCRWGGRFQGRMVEVEDLDAWLAIERRYEDLGGCQHDEGVTAQGTCSCCKRVRLVNAITGEWKEI